MNGSVITKQKAENKLWAINHDLMKIELELYEKASYSNENIYK